MNITAIVNKIFLWVKGSADNSPGGASSKKLSAFWSLVFVVTPIVFAWAIWAVKKGDWTYLPHMIDALLVFSATCLGVNAWEKKNKVANLGQNEETK